MRTKRGGLVLSNKSMIRTLFCNVLAVCVLLPCRCHPSLAFHLSEETQHHQQQLGLSEAVAVANDNNQVVWPRTSHWSPQRDRLSGDLIDAHDGNSRRRRLSPSEGVVRVLVLLIRFPEHANRVLPTVADIQTLCDEQIASYLYQQSYGKYVMSCDVQDWVTADNSEEYYSGGNYGRTDNIEIQKIFHPGLNKLDQEAAAAGNPDYWMQFDMDSNGIIDTVLAIHSGYGAEFDANDCTNDRESSKRIQSQAFSESNIGGWVSSEETLKYALGGFVILAGLERYCGEEFLLVGKAAHELIHTMGSYPAPSDLYDVTTGGSGAGGFDIMSSFYGPSGQNGKAPGSMSPWTKQFLNWITPTEISANGEYSMRPSTDHPDYFVIKSGYPDKEYLLMEYRVPVSPWDEDFFGSGMVLYHIDDAANLQTQPGFPDQGDFPQNGKHYQVAVVQADGLFQLEQGEGLGDEGDLYTPGMSIGPGPRTFRNTDSYQNGQITQTGITITVVSMDSLALTLRVEGMVGSASTPSMALPVTAQPPASEVSPPIASSPVVSSPTVAYVPPAPTILSNAYNNGWPTAFATGFTSTISSDGTAEAPPPTPSSPPQTPPAATSTSRASPSLLDTRSKLGIQRMVLLLTASVVYVWML